MSTYPSSQEIHAHKRNLAQAEPVDFLAREERRRAQLRELSDDNRMRRESLEAQAVRMLGFAEVEVNAPEGTLQGAAHEVMAMKDAVFRWRQLAERARKRR
jgi:hypothetical protein